MIEETVEAVLSFDIAIDWDGPSDYQGERRLFFKCLDTIKECATHYAYHRAPSDREARIEDKERWLDAVEQAVDKLVENFRAFSWLFGMNPLISEVKFDRTQEKIVLPPDLDSDKSMFAAYKRVGRTQEILDAIA